MDQLEKNSDLISKVAVTLGGFIIIVGIILLGAFSLVVFGIFDPTLFLAEDIKNLFIWSLFILGVVDLISGIILLSK